MKKFVTLVAALAALVTAAPSQAATVDTATASSSVATAHVGEVVTFTSTTPCTVACRLTWTWREGSRLGWRMGEGQTIRYVFTKVDTGIIQLDLSEPCAGSGGRLICHSYAYVYVTLTN